MSSNGTAWQGDAEASSEPKSGVRASMNGGMQRPYSAGQVRYGKFFELLRGVVLVTWALVCCVSIHVTQLLGSPLYWINKDYYYAYMSLTKQSFGLLITTVTQWFSPTLIRISGDKSVRGQLCMTKDGRLQTRFPERLVMIANHQIYTDWLYLWWVAYTNQMHGHIFIVLKESLKYIPILGPGMMFYSFIFMARKWIQDKPRLAHRLGKLKTQHAGPLSGSQSLDPMWMLLFPEGTNLCSNGRVSSHAWAEKNHIRDMKHQLLPRSTGLLFCLQELEGTVDYIYDCTVAYEGMPRGQYAQDYFTLRSMMLQGRPPKSVNMYWRRLSVKGIPLHDPTEFDVWLRDRWAEKDELLEHYAQNGRFPADEGCDSNDKNGESKSEVVRGVGYIETEVRLAHWFEVFQIFVVLSGFALMTNILVKAWNLFTYGSLAGRK